MLPAVRDVEVLVLTGELDFASDRVCRDLAAEGVSFLRLNREDLAGSALTLDPVKGVLLCSRAGTTWRAADRLKAVWWRQGTFDRTPHAADDPLQEQMAKTQWSAFMRAVMALDRAVWVNLPSAVYRAETKAVQLREAARLGFDVPATLMTNDPAADVGARMGSHVALKSVDTLLLRDGPDQLFGYTTLLEWDGIAHDGLKSAPVTVQAALVAKTDLRVTVVGDALWCVAVTRRGAGIDGDWRLVSKDELFYRDHHLPSAVAGRCLALVRGLGLRFGAIDLALSEDRYWFVEVNPTGEWGWLDNASRPISRAIARFLAAPTC